MTYSSMELLDIRSHQNMLAKGDFCRKCDISTDTAQYIDRLPPIVTLGRQRRKQHERKQKRGCQTGTLERLRKQVHMPPLPSLLLTNARSPASKINELQLQIATDCLIQNCCVMIFIETWLYNSIPDTALQLSGQTSTF